MELVESTSMFVELEPGIKDSIVEDNELSLVCIDEFMTIAESVQDAVAVVVTTEIVSLIADACDKIEDQAGHVEILKSLVSFTTIVELRVSMVTVVVVVVLPEVIVDVSLPALAQVEDDVDVVSAEEVIVSLLAEVDS